MSFSLRKLSILSVSALMCGLAGAAHAADTTPACADQPPGPNLAPTAYTSIEVLDDKRVQFRLCAPRATNAKVSSSDIEAASDTFAGKLAGFPMQKDNLGYWIATSPTPVAPGVYSYHFEIDGVKVTDPQGTEFTQEYRGVRSILEVKGPEVAAQSYDANVAHGAVAVIEYPSTTLGYTRRAHVYTPPGYEKGGNKRYPVLYLVHGAGDSDDSWTSKGHAQYIIDNLIAAKKAEEMIVVMPYGHTPVGNQIVRPGIELFRNTDFGDDLVKDLIPYIDRNYRTEAKAASRAMAGLSMGGSHTLSFGLPNPDVFGGGVGVFSMGFFQEEQYGKYVEINDKGLKKRAETKAPVFYGMGRTDFLYQSAAPTRKMLDAYKIKYTYRESGGGHTWGNWRAYLTEFAPMLFH